MENQRKRWLFSILRSGKGGEAVKGVTVRTDLLPSRLTQRREAAKITVQFSKNRSVRNSCVLCRPAATFSAGRSIFAISATNRSSRSPKKASEIWPESQVGK